jgi:hypothetical protein
MKKTLPFFFFVLSVLFFHSVPLSAQKNFVRGFIITLKKDTLKGNIDYREWGLNPAMIHFTDEEGNKHTFTPDDIAGFFIPPKDHYTSIHVSLDLSSFQLKDLMEFKEPRSVKDTALFLMTIVKGKASLYYLKDRNEREHFYVSKDNEPLVELLLKKKYIMNSVGSTQESNYVSTLELFKGQLIVLFNDCPEMKALIDRSAYSIPGMRSIVVRYNQCRNSTMEFVKKEEKIKVKFGILAGPSLTKITFKGGENDLSGVKMPDCYSFLAGVSIHLIFPRERAQWSLVNELVYKPYSSSATTSESPWSTLKYDRTFSFKIGYIKLFTLVRYQYPNWKVRPFADFGISNNYKIKMNNTETVVKTFGGTVTTSTEPPINDPKLYELGILGGVGVSFWKVSGELRYEWTQGMSPYTTMSSPENNISFVVSFIF